RAARGLSGSFFRVTRRRSDQVPIRTAHMRHSLSILFVAAVTGAASLAAAAEKKTVCTITVNSSDEKETFRANLPRDRYQFVELVEKGRHDWLASSCKKGIQCDV